MSRLIGVCVLVIISFGALSQTMGPLSGSLPKAFSTLPDNLGFLDNSVNLFNGQVQF
jgi:hypothetical protein